MNVTVLSAFRDATAYLGRYFDQVTMLNALLADRGDTLTLVLAEGDSSDGTEWLLDRLVTGFAPSLRIVPVKHEHGGPRYGSIEHPQRFKQLAGLGNALLRHIPRDADAVMLVESDLVWAAKTLVALLDRLQSVHAVAPMVMDRYPADRFYDVFAFRRKGERFANDVPYHPDLATMQPGDLLELESAGSVLAMRGHLARRVYYPTEDVIVGLCRQLRSLGGSIWLDPGLVVRHP